MLLCLLKGTEALSRFYDGMYDGVAECCGMCDGVAVRGGIYDGVAMQCGIYDGVAVCSAYMTVLLCVAT